MSEHWTDDPVRAWGDLSEAFAFEVAKQHGTWAEPAFVGGLWRVRDRHSREYLSREGFNGLARSVPEFNEGMAGVIREEEARERL